MKRMAVAFSVAVLAAGCDSDDAPTDAGADAGLDSPVDSPVDIQQPETPTPAAFVRRITIDRNQVGDSTTTSLSNYPLLVSLVDRELNTDHLFFEADSPETCAGAAPCTLAHEIEAHDPTTGTLVAWVRVPDLNGPRGAADTVIRLRHGGPEPASPAPAPHTVWAAFSAVWHFTPKQGDPTRESQDSTINQNHGPPSPANQYRAYSGLIGKSASFHPQSPQAIQVADHDSLDLSATGSVSVWYASGEGLSSYRAIVAKGPRSYYGGGDQNTVNYGLQLTSAGGVSFHLGDGAQQFLASANQHRRDAGGSAYYHLAVIWEQGMAWIYDDGVLATAPQPVPLIPSPNALPLLIGGYAPYSASDSTIASTFSGNLDELRISKTPVTAAWIATDFRSQRDPTAFLQVGPPEAVSP